MNLITDKKELKKYSLCQLLDICLYNESEIVKDILKNWLTNENNFLNEYQEKIDGIGSLTSGVVYLKGNTYRLAGFILKRIRKVKMEKYFDYIFIPVYADAHCNFSKEPIVFYGCCNLYDDHGFVSDGVGNFIHFDEIIKTKKQVTNYVNRKRYDLNQVIKANGLYLNI